VDKLELVRIIAREEIYILRKTENRGIWRLAKGVS
jgi:hypothetical protein